MEKLDPPVVRRRWKLAPPLEYDIIINACVLPAASVSRTITPAFAHPLMPSGSAKLSTRAVISTSPLTGW